MDNWNHFTVYCRDTMNWCIHKYQNHNNQRLRLEQFNKYNSYNVNNLHLKCLCSIDFMGFFNCWIISFAMICLMGPPVVQRNLKYAFRNIHFLFSFLFSFIVSFTKLLQFPHIDREESAECVGAVMMKINNSFLYRQKYFRIGIRVCDRIIHKYIHKTSSTARKMVINDTSMWENSWCNKFNP